MGLNLDRTQARWLWLTLLTLILDQLSKWWIQTNFQLHESVPVVRGFNLVLVYNPGAAFSFLGDQGGWQRWFFIGIATLVSVSLVIWLLRLTPAERVASAALALILGGAMGNLIDRLWIGQVVDFIDWYYGAWHWPAFNLADSAICLGVALMLWDGLVLEPRRRATLDGAD